MRFLADGPSLPDELLEARDEGNVVFFCGAGMSLPAGLPSFLQLSKLVVDKLGTPPEAPSHMLLQRALSDPQFATPLDQIFHLLRYEYGAEYIDQVTSDLLVPPSSASTELHKIVLRLSRSADSRPQVVTTNFDLLFELADPLLVTHIGPSLPNLSVGPPLEGIVYLHGRRDAAGSGSVLRQTGGLILSSADFGRAYLSEGWATTFVTQLLRRYTIVLVGYSATDPPVRYLLEGLHSRGEESPPRIYAFDQGSQEEVQERWRDRGVRALAYRKSDAQHSALWDTLRNWAERADDPGRWQQSVLDLATKDPKSLPAYQRGQVAALVRTGSGAKLLGECTPPPSAEWLCVFDRNVRYSAPYTPYGEEREIDPLMCYGLDDDPPRPATSEARALVACQDLLSITPTLEERALHPVRLAADNGSYHIEPMPSRLFHLSQWMIQLLDDPILLWWVAGYEALHPRLLELIKWQLLRNSAELTKPAYQAWILILERFRERTSDSVRDRWFDFVRQVKKHGWTTQTFREFERTTQPYLTAKRPNWGRGLPPLATWENLRLGAVVTFGVEFCRRDAVMLLIPSDALPEVVRILRRSLERASGLLADIDPPFWRTATFIPDGTGASSHLNEVDAHLLWFVRLFDRWASEHPDQVRQEMNRWPAGKPFLFDKLWIYAWMKRDVISATDVAEGILALTDEAFWNTYYRRELLHTLAARWNDLHASARARIENRVIAGPPSWKDEDAKKHQKRRAIDAAKWLGWLLTHGCELSGATQAMLPQLRAADPRWQPEWDASVAESAGPRVRNVGVNSDPSEILDTPLDEVISHATKLSRHEFLESIEYDPFQGLVAKRPQRALAALTHEARKGNYPVEFWRKLLSRAPENISQRLRWTITRRAVRLPTNIIVELRHALPDFLQKHLPQLAAQSVEEALNVWDKLLDRLLVAGDSATASSLGDTSIGGRPQHRSRRTSEHAVNSPVGRMTGTLIDMLSDLQLGPGAGLPPNFQSRLERLLSAVREPKDHAISRMTSRLTWLYQVDPQWTAATLLTRLDPAGEDAEPAWSGYTYDRYQAGPALFTIIKPHFLQLFSCLPKWHWDDTAAHHFAELLVMYCFWNENGGGYVSFEETRRALQSSDDTVRSTAVWTLIRIVRDHHAWSNFGRPFIERAWPRERRFQSAATAGHLAELARAADDAFPEAVDEILPLLVPVDHTNFLFDEIAEDTTGDDAETHGKLIARFPERALALLDRLVGHDVRAGIYGLGPALRAITDALPKLRQDSRWRRLNEIVTRS